MKWEYKTIKVRVSGLFGAKLHEAGLDAMMNELGEEGWELSAALNTTGMYGGTVDVVVIFKRQTGK